MSSDSSSTAPAPAPAPTSRQLLVWVVSGESGRSELEDQLSEALCAAGIDCRSVGTTRDAIGPHGRAGITFARLPVPRELEVELELVAEDQPLFVLATGLQATDRARLISLGVDRILEPETAADDLIMHWQADESPQDVSDSWEHNPSLIDFLSRSPSMREFVETATKAAPSDASLLITGETGVGKERLARALHGSSTRASGPFVAVNCGAFPEQLLESQLFGHEKGAFTGAVGAHAGFFEQAEGGTIFLDEIGEMPQHLQVKLLTVLQRREIQRLGAQSPQSIDVRVMAATNKDLAEEIEAGGFRQDLYFRLNVVSLRIPPLRERPSDIPDLVGGLLEHFSDRDGMRTVQRVSPDAMRALVRYDWPGNIRELINAIERSILLGDGGQLRLEDLPDEVREAKDLATPPADQAAAEVSIREESSPDLPEQPGATPSELLPEDWSSRTLKSVREDCVERVEREYLSRVLSRHEGQVGKAAEAAGIGPRSLYDKMKRLGLRKEDFRPG